MELVSPAGNLEKLKYAYLFGADAVYIGIKDFSLRAKAENFKGEEYKYISKIKETGKKLYCALNIFFFDDDIKRLEKTLEYIKEYPFDGFIVSDIGIISLLKKHFPDVSLHLSTQANCINSQAARMYKDMGFSRIILGRELSLNRIEKIKNKIDIQVEVFVHGAMCLAYSGRCFLSAYMAGRSANKGDCAHSCRWKYLLLEEEERKGEYFPVFEGDNYTIILSSKDICMIDHLKELKNAGVDAIKIEGRMKSVYYTAITTRAYRKMLDAIEGKKIQDLMEYRNELFKVSQREFSTGFFFGKEEISIPTDKSYIRPYNFLGFIGAEVSPGLYNLEIKNQILAEDVIEYIGCDILFTEDSNFKLFDENMNEIKKADHGKTCFLKTDKKIKEGYIIRRKEKQQSEKKI